MKRAEPSKRHAADCLRDLEYQVEEIPETTAKRADLRATRVGEEFLIEAKGRAESEEWMKFIEALRQTGSETLSREIEPWNALSSMIKRAYSQLSETPASADAVRLLWVPAVHQDDEFVLSCIFRQLYGVTQLSCIKRMSLEERPTTKDCYFYERGDFRRFRDLDGAVLAGRATGALCVNPFSPRAARLRSSTLHRYFAENGAVRDPEVLDRDGGAFFLGDDFTGSTPRDAWAYIRQRYGVLTSPMSQHAFDTRVLVSVEARISPTVESG